MQRGAKPAAQGPWWDPTRGIFWVRSPELSHWERWHPDNAFPGGCLHKQKGEALGRREAMFINQGLRIARVAFTAPAAPVCCWGMMQNPHPARLCSRSISAPPVPYPLLLFIQNLSFSIGECHLVLCPHLLPSTPSLLTCTSTSGAADGVSSCT